MTMNVSSICRGFRAPSELAQAAGGYQAPWTLRFLQEFWQWLTGATREINGFSAAVPFILLHLEALHRRGFDRLGGEVRMNVWLNDQQTLRLDQSPDGQRLYATIVTQGERDLVSELVEGFPGPGSILQQLHVKLAHEFLHRYMVEGLHERPDLGLVGNFWDDSQSLSPLDIQYGDIYDLAVHVLGRGQLGSPSAPDSVERATDMDIAIQRSELTALGDQQRRNQLQYQRSEAEQIFGKNTPNAETSAAVRAAIQCKLDGLSSSQGLQNSGGDIVSLVGGADVISGAEFDGNDEETEWCLLRSGTKTYTFMTIDAARGLMQSTQIDPFNRAPITANSFIRGEKMLEILQTFPDDQPGLLLLD